MISIQLNDDEVLLLRDKLNLSAFTPLEPTNQYEVLRGRLGGSTLVLYSSNKLLINRMTNDLESLLKSILMDGCKGVGVGSDEAGKGEPVGPIVVAAVKLYSSDCVSLRLKGIKDSKSISEKLVWKLGPHILNNFTNRFEILEPSQFNSLFKPGNLNHILRDLHWKVLSPLISDAPRIVIDAFSPKENSFFREKISSNLIYTTKAERYPEVAAASILSKYLYLKWLDDFKNSYGFDPREKINWDSPEAPKFLKLSYIKS